MISAQALHIRYVAGFHFDFPTQNGKRGLDENTRKQQKGCGQKDETKSEGKGLTVLGAPLIWSEVVLRVLRYPRGSLHDVDFFVR